MLLFLLAACSTDDDPVDCNCAPCPAVPAATSSPLEDWELQVLDKDLQSLRAGIQPRGEQGFGLCEGAQSCDRFLGAAPGELPPGAHILQAELDVPRLGEDWKVRFDLTCSVTTPAGTELDVDHSKTYGVVHTGSKQGYRLSPLWKIQSPHPQGARDCQVSLTPVRPDGQDGTPIIGSYKTPMPEAK